MICLLINYYWALYLGKKYTYIEINAKEWLENLYYSFISVTGLVGRQQSHLKCLLACWQNATETRWKPLVWGSRGVLTQTLGGCTDLAAYCPSYFSPWDTNSLSSLGSTFKEAPPNMDACLLWILNVSVGSRACPRQICLQTQKGNRKRKEKLWQPKDTIWSIKCTWQGLWKHGSSLSLGKALLVNDNSFGEDIGPRRRGPDSSFISFTTCVAFDKTGNHSGPHFPHLSNGWVGQETFSLQVFLQNTSLQTQFYIKLHYIYRFKRNCSSQSKVSSPFLIFSHLPGTPKSLCRTSGLNGLYLENHKIGYVLRTLPDWIGHCSGLICSGNNSLRLWKCSNSFAWSFLPCWCQWWWCWCWW